MLAVLFACLALAAAADPAPPPPAPGDEAGEGGPLPVPPGSREDQELWKAADEVGRRIVLERYQANRMQWQARQKDYLKRLEAFGKGDGPAARRAAEILPAYRKALVHNHTTLTRQWPVDPSRGCQYPMANLAGVLHSEHPRKASQLAVVREDVSECVEKARPAMQVMADSNAELRRLTAEIDAFLPPQPIAVPTPPAAAPRPAPRGSDPPR